MRTLFLLFLTGFSCLAQSVTIKGNTWLGPNPNPPVPGGSPAVYSISTNIISTPDTNWINVANDAGTGANRLRLALVLSFFTGFGSPITNQYAHHVFDGSTEMTLLGWTNYHDGGRVMAAYYNVAPPTGSGTIWATNGEGSGAMGLIVMTLTNVNQSATLDTVTNQQQDTVGTITNTTVSAANELNTAFGAGYSGADSSLTVGSGVTVAALTNVAFKFNVAITTQPGSAGTVTDFFNWGTSTRSALISVGIKGP